MKAFFESYFITGLEAPSNLVFHDVVRQLPTNDTACVCVLERVSSQNIQATSVPQLVTPDKNSTHSYDSRTEI